MGNYMSELVGNNVSDPVGNIESKEDGYKLVPCESELGIFHVIKDGKLMPMVYDYRRLYSNIYITPEPKITFWKSVYRRDSDR